RPLHVGCRRRPRSDSESKEISDGTRMTRMKGRMKKIEHKSMIVSDPLDPAFHPRHPRAIASSGVCSITRIVFHLPLRKRTQKHTLMPQMCAVANTQHQYTFPPSHTVSAVGITISGHASANVSFVTYFVSPAPRSANANDRLIASVIEKNATNSS